MNRFGHFFKMIKFEHSIFALPFAYAGMFLAAHGLPTISQFFWITLAMVSFRTMSMAANRVVDRKIDLENPRTASREIPAGTLKLPFVWSMIVFSFILFEMSCFFLNSLCFKLSPVPMALAWLYPFMKRFSWACHFVLGLVLGIAPYGAWLGVNPEFSWVPGFMLLSVLTWVAGFDMIYALLDVDFDRNRGLYSAPAKLGVTKTLRLTRVLHGLTFIFMCLTGIAADLNVLYFFWMVGIGVLLVKQNLMVRDQSPEKINMAFFNMNVWVSVLFLLAIIFAVIF